MIDTAIELKQFFSGFGLPAYIPQGIPDELMPPYITYLLSEPRWDTQGNTYCQIWYPKGQLEELLTKADQVKKAIGEGVKITMPDGYIVLYLATNQAQIMSDEWTISAYISLLINVYHLPGT